ncbi:hypothetical protein KC19_10G088900 [Ceratodon purpureus]|uniref:Uncharacterized protein n=1 Tax=Ceratodon purpureus TaxID=3225 RepID=A0A8T0GM16_CERPU|nr:hypothetical protein KC19_10G088900 [Ceratodon purpureus]
MNTLGSFPLLQTLWRSPTFTESFFTTQIAASEISNQIGTLRVSLSIHQNQSSSSKQRTHVQILPKPTFITNPSSFTAQSTSTSTNSPSFLQPTKPYLLQLPPAPQTLRSTHTLPLMLPPLLPSLPLTSHGTSSDSIHPSTSKQSCTQHGFHGTPYRTVPFDRQSDQTTSTNLLPADTPPTSSTLTYILYINQHCTISTMLDSREINYDT